MIMTEGKGYTVTEPHTGPVGYFPQDPDNFPPVPDDPPYDATMDPAVAEEWRRGGPPVDDQGNPSPAPEQ
jgi:hypothetical protein